MRVGLFPLWSGARIGGIATYDSELLPALAEAAPADGFHVYSPLRDANRLKAQPHPANLHFHYLFPSTRWINVPVSFPVAALVSDVDLVHMTHVPPPFFTKRYVMTLHCFSTFAHPEFYPRLLNLRMNALIRKGLRTARMVICPSEGLRDLAETELKVDAARLRVAPHGVSAIFFPRDKSPARAEIRKLYGIQRSFLLFVGVMAPRKNGARIVEAFARFRQQTRTDVQLVVVGRKWLGADVDAAIRRAGLENEVVFAGHVPEQHLPIFYSAAELLLFPSLWESFGMPVAESMACGTPVITSAGSCLPETAGGAAILVDPHSIDEIAGAIANVLYDSALATDLRKRGLEQSKKFTWRNSALKTIAAYHAALET